MQSESSAQGKMLKFWARVKNKPQMGAPKKEKYVIILAQALVICQHFLSRAHIWRLFLYGNSLFCR